MFRQLSYSNGEVPKLGIRWLNSTFLGKVPMVINKNDDS
jgi:hypothetical protein